MVGPGSIVLIGAMALILFGPKKLPELGRAVGPPLKEFKQSTKGMMDDGKDDEKENGK